VNSSSQGNGLHNGSLFMQWLTGLEMLDKIVLPEIPVAVSKPEFS
jgi:hypothetical protein